MHWPFRQRSSTYLQSSEHRSQAEEVRKEPKMLTAVPSTRREVDKNEGDVGREATQDHHLHRLQASLTPSRVKRLIPSNDHHMRRPERPAI